MKTTVDLPFLFYFWKSLPPPFWKNHTKFWCGQVKRHSFFIFKKMFEKIEIRNIWVCGSAENIFTGLQIFFSLHTMTLSTENSQKSSLEAFSWCFFNTKPIFFKKCKTCCFVRAAGCETATKNINSWLYIFFSPT